MSVFVAIEPGGHQSGLAAFNERCESGRENDRPANAKIFGLAASDFPLHLASSSFLHPSIYPAHPAVAIRNVSSQERCRACQATSSSPPSFSIISSRYWISSPEVSLSDYLSAVLAISQHRAGLAISFHELLLHSLIRSNITTSAGAFSPTNHWVSIASL